MSLLDLITGGNNEDAKAALRNAESVYANLQVPTAAQLTLPELQQYVQAGILTPAQAQAALQGPSAYDTTNVPTEGRKAQLGALSQLQEIANAKGMDATEQANLQNAINQMNTATAGQRGAILDSFAQRGVPLSLASLVQQGQAAGQDSQQANANALQGNADAEMRAVQAMQGAGSLGGQIQGQDWAQANTKAQAQNAINQWNSSVANNMNQYNAGNQQAANQYNAENKQNVSNANTQNTNARTEYNAQVPQTVYNDSLQKASGQAGAFTNAGNLAQQQGQQQAGLVSGLIGAGATIGAGGIQGAALTNAMKAMQPPQPTGFQNGPPAGANTEQYAPPGYACGGVVDMETGGMVPGHAQVPGDSPTNDTVPARLSPGELVVPRSLVHDFIQHMPPRKPTVHPEDITNVFHALSNLRNGGDHPNLAAIRG